MVTLNPCNWHPLVLHFPIVLILTALVFDLLGWIWKKNVYPAGHWILIMGGVMTIPTALTGLACFDDFAENPWIYIHFTFALLTVIYSLFHALYRVKIILGKKIAKPSFLVFLSVVNSLFVTLTAEYGGRIAFGKQSPAAITEEEPAPEPEHKKHHHHRSDSFSPQ